MENPMTTTPRHLLPTSCYVCGGDKHSDNRDHNYWSNADARREFKSQPQGTLPERPEGFYHTALEVL
jgi:hypothetical protein